MRQIEEANKFELALRIKGTRCPDVFRGHSLDALDVAFGKSSKFRFDLNQIHGEESGAYWSLR